MNKYLLALLSSIFLPTVAIAQEITPDTSLPNNSLVNFDDATQTNTIAGGTTAGNNLFHSFSQFNLPTGSEAFFDNAANIANILGRVTGGKISNIDGLISANGEANLYLVNPAGIVFGENAILNIGGTFNAVAGDSILFEDGSEFSAVAPDNPILSVSLPVGAQLGGEAGTIEVNGIGNGLFVNEFGEPDRSAKNFGLTASGFNLIAGNISFLGGDVTVQAGTITLATGNNGTAYFDAAQSNTTSTSGSVLLEAESSIDVSGNAGGTINIETAELGVYDGSAIIAFNEGDGTGGKINLNATETSVIGESASDFFSSLISVDNTFFATQTGGELNLDTESLLVDFGGRITATTHGEALGGKVNITAEDVDVVSGGSFASSILAQALYTGNGGEVNITADTIDVELGGQIATNTFDAKAGTLNLNAREINFTTPEIFGEEIFNTLILADSLGVGEGGVINIKAENLTVADFAQVSASATSSGRAGTINIETDNLTVTNSNIEDGYVTGIFNASGLAVSDETLGDAGDINIKSINTTVSNDANISSRTLSNGNGGNVNIEGENLVVNRGFIDARTEAEGNGGDINLRIDNLEVIDGGQIISSTNSTGNAGNIIIDSQNTQISGFADDGNSAILSTAIVDSGNGGNITLNSDRLAIDNGGTVSVSNFSTVNADLEPGTGVPGAIEINADIVEISGRDAENPSTISAAVNAQSGGNIDLNISDRLDLTGAGTNIEAESRGTGDGGSIDLNTPNLNLNNGGRVSVSASAAGNAGKIDLDVGTINSDRGSIVAESTQSGGGDIAIDSENIYLDDNSLLSTRVLDSNGGGGNITIDNQEIILLQNNSDIRANAVEGPGGNIDIATNLLFADFKSDIDASSQFGLDGEVEIDRGIDRPVEIEKLSEEVEDPSKLVTSICPVGDDNVFAITGRGGIPQQLQGNLSSANTAEVIGTPQASNTSIKVQNISHKPSTAIKEANGIYTTSKGEVIIAHNSSVTNLNRPWYELTSCSK